ncbi:MAG: hypothetical protein JWN73_1352 [Betaproteobacteria bacterium]|nr:hypothetical protein [Betaproteobacteria bacterium]
MKPESPKQLVYGPITDPEPVLAGTLCLMSAFLNGGGCMHLAQKVIHNLTVLSNRPEFSDEFRRTGLNLRAHWCNECARACAQNHGEPKAQAEDAALTHPAADRNTLH